MTESDSTAAEVAEMDVATATRPWHRRRFFEEWAPLAGIVAAVAFAAATVIAFTQLSGGDDVPETVALFERGVNDTWLGVSVLLFMVFGLLFLWFLGDLYAGLKRVAGDLLVAVTLIGGIVFLSFFLLGMFTWQAPLFPAGDSSIAADSLQSMAATYWLLENIGWFLIGFSAIAGGSMMIAASTLAVRYQVLPRWWGWAGGIAGFLAFFTLGLFFTLFLIPAWVLGTSVLMQLNAVAREEAKAEVQAAVLRVPPDA